MSNPRWLKFPDDYIDTELEKVSEDRADPVYRDGLGRFYFSDEVWCNLFGPFNTQKECREELNKYAERL
jgi:hypothetical protein